MNRRRFLSVTVASAAALVAGCDNDTLCVSKPPFSFGWKYTGRDAVSDEITLTNMSLHHCKTCYAATEWVATIDNDAYFNISRDDWLNGSSQISNGIVTRTVGLDRFTLKRWWFEPC